MRPLTEVERALLHSLAAAGKPTEVSGADSLVGKVLEQMGLVFFVRNSASAVITPKGRHLIQELESPLKPISTKHPFGFLI